MQVEPSPSQFLRYLFITQAQVNPLDLALPPPPVRLPEEIGSRVGLVELER
jgi:hypothetical protein